MSFARTLARLFLTHRRRLAPLIVVLAGIVVGLSLADAVPREVHVRYVFGPDHADITEARFDYQLGDEDVQTVRYAYGQEGAPISVDHQTTLPPGHYQVVVALRGEGLERRISRPLEVPSAGMVRLSLYDEAYAGSHPHPAPAPETRLAAIPRVPTTEAR